MGFYPKTVDMALLAIIPLSDGTWTSAKKRTVYLPEVEGKVSLPPGINLVTVDVEAAKDEARRRLFIWLGAKILKHGDVCRELLRAHEHGRHPTSMKIEELLVHAQHLFSASDGQSLPTRLPSKFWVADTEGNPRHGTQLYMDDPVSARLVSIYFKTNPNVAPFLHRQYLELYDKELGKRERWLSWLQKHLGGSAHLRLCTTDKTNISDEFMFIIRNNSSRQWLTVLKDNYLWKTPSKDEQTVREKVALLPVTCTDGSLAPLKDTVLPTLRSSNPLAQAADLKYVDIDDEGNNQWQRIAAFGVTIAIDLRFDFKVMQNLPRLNASPKKSDMERLYKEILSRSNDARSQDLTR